MTMRIHIFKAGEQISSSGYTKTFSEQDLDSMVTSFDPSLHEPPIRVGHEDSDKVPAYGWVKKVSREGENLYAEVEFTPEMEEMIRNGNYKKVSASFYPPDSMVNPKKGHYTLKHVAMLGGVAPAVKGLEGISFSEEADETIMAEIEFECSGSKKKKKKKPQEEEVLMEEEALPEEEEKEDEEFAESTPEEALPLEEEFAESTPARVVLKVVEEEAPEEEEEEEEALPEEEEFTEPEPTPKEKEAPPKEEEELPEEEEEEEEEEFAESSPVRAVLKPAPVPPQEEDLSSELAERLRMMEVKFAELKASEEKAQAELQKVIRERRCEVLTAQVEHLYKEGQMTEGIFPQTELLEFVVGLDEGTLEFAEGETASDRILHILSRIPAPVNFSELVTEEEAPVVEEEFEDFSEKVENYAKKHNVTFEQALRALAN